MVGSVLFSSSRTYEAGNRCASCSGTADRTYRAHTTGSATGGGVRLEFTKGREVPWCGRCAAAAAIIQSRFGRLAFAAMLLGLVLGLLLPSLVLESESPLPVQIITRLVGGLFGATLCNWLLERGRDFIRPVLVRLRPLPPEFAAQARLDPNLVAEPAYFTYWSEEFRQRNVSNGG